MATVNNNLIPATKNAGNSPAIGAKSVGTTKVPENQSKEAIQSVNNQYTTNPNHSRPSESAGDRNNAKQNLARGQGSTAPPAKAKDGKGELDEQSARNNRSNKQTEPEKGEDGSLANRPNRGERGNERASEQGILNGRGHHKSENQGETQKTPPLIVFPNDEKGNQNGKTKIMPPVIFNPNDLPDGDNHHNRPVFTTRGSNQTNNEPNLGVRLSPYLNLKAHGNQPLGLIRQVLSDVLGQNDIYLNRNTINRLVNNQTYQNNSRTDLPNNVPRDVQKFVQNVGTRVVDLLNNTQTGGKLIPEISKEISRQIRENIQAAKAAFVKNADLGAVHFKNLNIVEKMNVAVDHLPQHVPAKALESIQNHKAQEVLNGLMLARGFVVPNEQTSEIRNLVALKSSVLPSEISMTTMRDVGQLVKVLIADTAMAKTTANLDLAVQKFVKILLANNELGVLLATINLAAQSQNQGGLISRSLALAQIYQLINQLVQAGEKAMKEAAPDKNLLQKDRNIFQSKGVAAIDESDETKSHNNKLALNEAAASLRNFLEFNPNLIHDNSASAFNNPDDARQAQKEFINLYHDDIEAWLKSGNHRFVKDFDFDKPVGVVVERSNDNIFTANTARFVLVRDGSVQGWHFLKSFLVK